MKETVISQPEIDHLYERMKKDAEASGYFFNPDLEFTKELIKGLLINEQRYGYQSCPCRISSGSKEKDLDIICPCDYRDDDLNEYGTCYCALYVSKDIADGKEKASSIPERRLISSKKIKQGQMNGFKNISSLLLPVWRCKVCGYLCARENPPQICPICKANQERFELFLKL